MAKLPAKRPKLVNVTNRKWGWFGVNGDPAPEPVDTYEENGVTVKVYAPALAKGATMRHSFYGGGVL